MIDWMFLLNVEIFLGSDQSFDNVWLSVLATSRLAHQSRRCLLTNGSADRRAASVKPWPTNLRLRVYTDFLIAVFVSKAPGNITIGS